MKAPTGKAAPAREGTKLTVRHYCQGIGDCHLLRFPLEDGKVFTMLIDCGVHSSVTGGNDKIDKIVADVFDQTGGNIDLLVVTHEHWDHVSGFLTAAERFKSFKVKHVWAGWTENPDDAQAQQLDKYKGAALAALQNAALALARSPRTSAAHEGVQAGLDALAGFQFGATGDKVRTARNAAFALGKGKIDYMEPKSAPLALPGVSGVRVYVLGPPRDGDLLKITDRPSEMYGMGLAPVGWELSAMMGAAPGLNGQDNGGAPDYFAPFDPEVGSPLDVALSAGAGSKGSDVTPEVAGFVREHYLNPASTAVASDDSADQSWRRIDDDWLFASADLAMQIDARTNNTSLALAFEFTDTGRVALFAADAQVGSWLSWLKLEWTVEGKKVTMADLYPRVVYYKVGHHGSENATLKANGLELMTHTDLSAFIPTNAADALKVKWGQMPFKPMLSALEKKTSGRVVRADDDWIASSQAPKSLVGGSIRAVDHGKDLWVEFDIA